MEIREELKGLLKSEKLWRFLLKTNCWYELSLFIYSPFVLSSLVTTTILYTNIDRSGGRKWKKCKKRVTILGDFGFCKSLKLS